MADVFGAEFFGGIKKLFRDMGDDSHAEVVALGGKVVADPATTTQADYNVTLTSADTQYSQALPANCRGFEFQCRTDVAIRWSKTTGKVAGPTAPYKTLKAGDYYWSPPLNQGASPDTLYFASASAGVIIELTAWT